ncbi:MAG: ATP-binding protein [bacterium]
MTHTTNYKLIYELFDSVVIFDKNDRVVFEGRLIKELLDNYSIDVHKITPGQIPHDQNEKLLIASLAAVDSNLEPLSFKFPVFEDEFILFPVGFDNQPQVILTLKEKFCQITQIEHDLKERVKELQCLYNVSKELEISRPLDESFQLCVPHVHSAFQYPDDTLIYFRVYKKDYGDTNWDESTICAALDAEIIANGKKAGEVKVLLKNKRGFLEEEKKMLDEVALKFSRAIEEAEKSVNIEKQQKILLAKNEALLRLTNDCNRKQQKLRTFFSAITDKIVVIDRDFEIIMSNKEEIGDSGKCYNKLFGLNSRCEKCPTLKTFETGENNMVQQETGEKYLTLRSYAILDETGSVDRVLEVCRDITEQKKMEVQMIQSYKLASLGKLVAGVAHEINNPNTFILGNLKIIQEAFHDIFPVLEEHRKQNPDLKIARLDYGIFKENISTLVEDMINGANRTKKIVNDLRNFAKKDEDTFTDDVDLNDIIKNKLTLTSKHVKKYAELEIELADNLPTFKGNLNKLEQVILNFVMNASEAIEGDKGVIKIRTVYDEQTNEVLLIVEDNGCGIDEPTLKKIFDPFFTTKRNSGGTGLGLSISYGIIKDHNGRIEVESKPGIGTKFTIRIPVKQNL